MTDILAKLKACAFDKDNMPKCPFDDPSFNIGYDTPCPLCGALGGDDSDDITAKCAAAIGVNNPALESCASCDVNLADPPSKLCPGCQAYREHQS